MREELALPWASAAFPRLAPEGPHHRVGTAVEVSRSFGANKKEGAERWRGAVKFCREETADTPSASARCPRDRNGRLLTTGEPDDLLLFLTTARCASDGASLRLADALRRPPEPARLGRSLISPRQRPARVTRSSTPAGCRRPITASTTSSSCASWFSAPSSSPLPSSFSSSPLLPS